MKAIVFVGQGSQYQGMGKSLYDNFENAKKLFLKIDDILGFKISEICFYGEAGVLKNTYFQQLAILATSLVCYEVFKEKNIKIDFLSGLSLGEYTCLYPAQVLSLDQLLYLVSQRAKVMDEASKNTNSGMFAVVGLDFSKVKAYSQAEGFYISNINSYQQIVISLSKDKKEHIKNILEKEGARVIELEVSGGFHSPFMETAQHHLRKVIDNLKFNDAKIPIVSNFTAKAHIDKDEIKSNLINQLISTVLWKDCVEYMIKEGVDIFFEIGPSRVLSNLIKKINPNVKVVNIEKKEDLDNLTVFQ
ncbi:MAG: ACP S-malonyltransferase [Candidatus Omnitrophica bacterium]|nr:ACP S-malonyltransferase [Candidatus Omnitrophota bacterium]MCM8831763.1 ACP S-malonyltransferase [Candidatus Omnitrophota bacterium]